MESRSTSDGRLEINALQVLKKEMFQLEMKSSGLRKKLKSTKNRVDKLNSNIHLSKQQIDLFTKETNRALEGIKDMNWQFTKEICAEISKIKKPNSTLLDVSEKFMLILDQKDRSWLTFKAVMNNYAPLKSLMSNIQIHLLTEEQLNDLLNVWKNQQAILYNLQKYCRGVSIITDWIVYSVEYKLKKETLESFEKRHPEVFNK